jgi:hypothetical protein
MIYNSSPTATVYGTKCRIARLKTYVPLNFYRPRLQKQTNLVLENGVIAKGNAGIWEKTI